MDITASDVRWITKENLLYKMTEQSLKTQQLNDKM